MTKKILIFSALSALFFSSHVLAYPESTAFETSMEAAGQILSSPALPSLDNENMSLTPLVGIVTMEGITEEASLENGDPLRIENRGTVKGQIAGLSFNYSTKGDVGYFALLGMGRVEGDMASYIGAFSTTSDVRNISAQSLVGAVGLTYRLIGDQKSKFAMGIFAGPAFIKSTTTSQVHHDSGVTKVTVNPDISGYYFGLQFAFRFGFLRINPYMNILGNPGVQCLKPEYSGDTYPTQQYNRCDNGEHGVSTFAVLGGSGINVGYGRFQIGLVQSGGTGQQSMKTTPLLLSFRVSL